MPVYTVTLVLPDREVRFPCDSDTFILDAAAQNGIDLPHLCLQGWCLTCAGKILEGQVDQSASRRYLPADAAAGFVLLCTARPRSDVRVQTHQKDAMRAFRHQHGLPAPRG
jgi:ferredoxin